MSSGVAVLVLKVWGVVSGVLYGGWGYEYVAASCQGVGCVVLSVCVARWDVWMLWWCLSGGLKMRDDAQRR